MAVVEASYALSLARGQGVCIFSVLFFIEKLGFLCVCVCSLCCIAGIPCQLNSVACHKALYRTSDQGHCFVWVLYWENCFLAFLSHSLSAYGCRLVSVRFTIDRAGQKICDHLRLFLFCFLRLLIFHNCENFFKPTELSQNVQENKGGHVLVLDELVLQNTHYETTEKPSFGWKAIVGIICF